MGVVRLRDVWGGECVFDDGSTLPVPAGVEVWVSDRYPGRWKVTRAAGAPRAYLLGVGQARRAVMATFQHLSKPP